MNQELADKLATEFKSIKKIECSSQFMNKGQEHNPTKLKKEKEKGVYVFFLNDICYFKVGKAGTKSTARWNSHHYNLDKSTPSTFTKSFLSDLENFKSYFADDKQKIEINSFQKTINLFINDTNNFNKTLKYNEKHIANDINKFNTNEISFKKLISKLDKDKVKELSNNMKLDTWIKENLSRFEFLIPNSEFDYDLDLLEKLIAFRLRPIYEG